MKTLLIILMLLSKMQTAQNKAVIEGDFLSMTNALQSYKVITGDYPSTEQGLKALVNKPSPGSKKVDADYGRRTS